MSCAPETTMPARTDTANHESSCFTAEIGGENQKGRVHGRAEA